MGVLATQIVMDEIDEIMQERSGLGETGETFLIGNDLFLRSDSRFFKEKTALKRKIDREAPRRAIGGKTGTMWLLDYRDIPVLNAYAPIKVLDLHWAIIAKMDEEELMSPIYNLRQQLFLGAAILTLAMLLVSYIFSRKLTQPIVTLDGKLSEMSRTGNYSDALIVESKDEIGSLVTSYNEMGSTIKMQTDSLKQELAERKKAEEAIKKEEKKYRALFEHAFAAIYIVDPDSRQILEANENASKQLGYTKDELVRMKIDDIDFGPSSEEHTAAIKELRNTGGKLFETTNRRKDGSVIDVEISSILIEYSGKIVIQSFVRDITERKKSDDALSESEYYLKKAQEITHLGHWKFTPGAGEVSGSSQLFKIFGLSQENITLDAFADIVHPDDKKYDLEKIQRGIEYGEPWDIEHRLLLKDGTVKWVHAVGEPVLDEAGKTKLLIGTVHDITNWKQVEEELRLHGEITLNMAEGVNLVRSNDGTIAYTNPKFAEMFGYDQDELLEKQVSILNAATGERAEEAVKEIINDLNETGVWHGEVENIKKDGTRFWCYCNVSMFQHYKYGEVFISVQTDITERKKAEEEIINAKNVAETANEAKSQFLATMSHEIRTPMNAIIGIADLLSTTNLSEVQKEYVGTFKSSGKNLLSILNDVLDMSKIEIGIVELEKVDFNAKEVIEKAVDTMSLNSYGKGVELNFNIYADVPILLVGDPNRIRQVLLNILGNAVKFTKKGEIFLELEKLETTDKTATLLFSISDTGIGISDKDKEKIFESFTQADSSTTRKYGGTGLGLPISKQFIEMMGGRIWVENNNEGGAVFKFTVTLPMQEYKDRRRKEKRKPLNLRDAKVLIVDNNIHSRLKLRETLESWGAIVTESESGIRALDFIEEAEAEEYPYSLIIIGNNMRDLDGFEVAQCIMGYPAFEDITIMMITPDNIEGNLAKAKAVGINEYIVKPVRRSALFNSINHYLEHKRGSNLIGVAGSDKTDKKTSSIDYGTPLRILLTEDDPVNQKVMLFMLHGQKHEVVVANNGKEAVDKAAKEKFDIILMDINMPVMDGYKATAAIREKEKKTGEHTPILAFTALAFKDDREKCLAVGMDDFVVKPVQMNELFKVIGKYAPASKTKSAKKSKATETKEKSKDRRKVFNKTEALKRIGGDEDILKQLAEEHIKHSSKLMIKMDKAVKTQDVEALIFTAHSVKGSLGTIGGEIASDIALNIEKLVKNGNLNEVKKEHALLKKAIKRLHKILSGLIGE